MAPLSFRSQPASDFASDQLPFSIDVPVAGAIPSLQVGEDLLGFRLLRELGRGAFARVFLAKELALAGRHVAVKITGGTADESHTLAQLQHSHIMPIYSAHLDPAKGLRAIVMPYFGGATLNELLKKVRHRVVGATGKTLVAVLDELAVQDDGQPALTTLASDAAGAAPDVPPLASDVGSVADRQPSAAHWAPAAARSSAIRIGQPARHYLEQASYIQAAVWLAARLAEALAHAHQRGILHRDIKPSNVLIAQDGQPMLLDFNLALDTKAGAEGELALAGGTMPYMAPEHLDAYNPEDPTPATVVGKQSDIYALGAVLFELLTGERPFSTRACAPSLPDLMRRMAQERRARVPSARELNPEVPRSLDAVVRRCLAPDPAQRYPGAAELAEDLQRELESLPLLHTREPSLSGRCRKWVRRHPRATSVLVTGTLSGIAIVTLAAVVISVRGRLSGLDAQGRWLAFQQGLIQAQLLVHTGEQPGVNLAEGREVCEHTLSLFGVLDRDDWMRRSQVTSLSPSQREKLAEDATELVLLLARVLTEQGRLTKSARARTTSLERAVQLLDRAERFAGDRTPRALYEDRSGCRRLLGDVAGAEADGNRAQATPVRTPRDHYLRATALAIEKRYDEAVPELRAALRTDPKYFWARFELGICYDQLGRFPEAAGAYESCVSLWPEFPWTYLNRGLAYSRLSRWNDAIDDYSEAIRLDPAFRDAYVNRGLAFLKQHRYVDARDDLDRALELNRQGGTVWAARAAAHVGLRELDAARADFDQALRESPGDQAILLSRGFAFGKVHPDQSLQDFDRIVAVHPESAEAHYGRAFVLGGLPNRTREAAGAAERAVALQPNLIAARCALAVLFARMGEHQRARDQIDAALEQEQSGSVYYAAACAYALESRGDDVTRDKAFHFLDQALQRHYGRELLASDPDLDPLRNDARFTRLVDAER